MTVRARVRGALRGAKRMVMVMVLMVPLPTRVPCRRASARGGALLRTVALDDVALSRALTKAHAPRLQGRMP